MKYGLYACRHGGCYDIGWRRPPVPSRCAHMAEHADIQRWTRSFSFIVCLSFSLSRLITIARTLSLFRRAFCLNLHLFLPVLAFNDDGALFGIHNFATNDDDDGRTRCVCVLRSGFMPTWGRVWNCSWNFVFEKRDARRLCLLNENYDNGDTAVMEWCAAFDFNALQCGSGTQVWSISCISINDNELGHAFLSSVSFF